MKNGWKCSKCAVNNRIRNRLQSCDVKITQIILGSVSEESHVHDSDATLTEPTIDSRVKNLNNTFAVFSPSTAASSEGRDFPAGVCKMIDDNFDGNTRDAVNITSLFLDVIEQCTKSNLNVTNEINLLKKKVERLEKANSSLEKTIRDYRTVS